MSTNLLSRLTADRLEELAAGCENSADQYEAQADAEDAEEPSSLADLVRSEANSRRQIVAVLQALAGAERAMLAEATFTDHPASAWRFTRHVELDSEPMMVPDGERWGYAPTLVAALAAVAEQEDASRVK